MAAKIRISVLSVAAAFALSACGGGGTAGVAPGTSPTSQLSSAQLQLFVPTAPSSQSNARGAKVLPSTTQSVQIIVTSGSGTPLNPQPAPFVFNVSATATGCQTATGGFSCTETINVPYGSLLFNIYAFAGQNASGAVVANGSTNATIGSGANNVAVTMHAQSIYVGASMAGGMGQITVDHSANTFSLSSMNNGYVTNGTVSMLPNGDEKFVVTNTTDPSSMVGEIAYVRELPGSVATFVSTGSTTVQPTGGVNTNGDWGGAVALQGCPTTGGTVTLSIAEVAGPAWTTTSPSYTSGTATTAISGGSATVNFTGTQYDSSGNSTGSPQTGSQTCSGGIFSAANQSAVAFSGDGFIVVQNSNGNVQPTDTHENGYGSVASGTLNVAAIASGTYDGFGGNFSVVGGSVVKGETPYQLQPVSSTTMNACPYSNFEAGTVNTAQCAVITFGSQTSQPGVILATVVVPTIGTQQGIVVVGQTSGGKYVIFGTFGSNTHGGSSFAFLQH